MKIPAGIIRRTQSIAVWLLMAGGLMGVGVAGASTLIKNSRVIDGTGRPALSASVRIDGDRIVQVGNLEPRDGETVVDANGLTLAPGFIDTHSHHDRALFEHPEALPVVSQGVTTIVVGQDGKSNHPYKQFFQRLEQRPVAVNVASYVGHNAVRSAVMGDDFARPATPAEIERMRLLVREGMQEGAFGFSSGLEYDPGIYAKPEELIALAREAGAFGGRYSTHIRSEDLRLDAAIDEAIALGRVTRMPVQISHVKLAMVERWGGAGAIIRRLEQARAEGVDITADIYPYDFWQSTMTVLFPDRKFTRESAQFALTKLATPEGIRISLYKPEPALVGLTLAEVAQQRRQDAVTVYLDLIERAQAYQRQHAITNATEVEMVIVSNMSGDDVATLMKWQHTNICSDGLMTDRHPRGHGSFARVLRFFVREQQVLSLEEAIRKMTGLAADHIGLKDRGLIAPGQAADLVLFDPELVADRATVETPALLAVGIAKVWVNGQLVSTDGKSTGIYSGKPLRRASH